jgi:lipoprotein NlpD
MRMRLALLVLALLVAACAARRPAPVVDRGAQPGPPVAEAPKSSAAEAAPVKPLPTHTVKRGETLVGIALQYGLDYRELAAWNNITNPNVISVGQVLVLAAPGSAQPAPAQPEAQAAAVQPQPGTPVATPLASTAPIEARPLANTPTVKVEPRGQKVPFSERALAQLGGEAMPPAPAAPAAAPPTAPSAAPPAAAQPPSRPAAEPEKAAGTDREDIDWTWPVKGKVIAPFTETTKGMDIGGRKGTPVLAAASGRVVYAGEGLRGYGKLVIIKHNNTWLSAYAHNDKLLVKEQEDVRKGQKIAEMGSTHADEVKLHFEVRRQGKPVDPAKVLPAM